MVKLKGNNKKIKNAVFNIGPIIILLLVACAIFMIGRAIGRIEMLIADGDGEANAGFVLVADET